MTLFSLEVLNASMRWGVWNCYFLLPSQGTKIQGVSGASAPPQSELKLQLGPPPMSSSLHSCGPSPRGGASEQAS